MTYRYQIIFLFAILTFSSTAVQAQFGQDVVGEALKEALDKGVVKASEALAQEDGYYVSPYKILLPEDAQQVAKKISSVPGFNDFDKELEEKLNRAAEDAAKKAAPIFLDAIKKMTIKDALKLLKGEEDAATQYLRDKTYDNLYTAFKPVIENSLKEVGALNLWEKGANTYNKIPFTKKVNPDMVDHVNSKALDGLFKSIAKEEKSIRDEPAARTTDLLKRVFGS